MSPGAVGRPSPAQDSALAVVPAFTDHLSAAAEIRARFEAVIRASPSPKVAPAVVRRPVQHYSGLNRVFSTSVGVQHNVEGMCLAVQMLGDYPKSSDGVDRRPFSWSTPGSGQRGPLISRLPRPPLRPDTRRVSSAAPQTAPAAGTPAPADGRAEAAPDRALELIAPPPKAPASLARIRLGEDTVLWQRSGQGPVRPIAGYGAAAASPAPTQSALVDYLDTAPRLAPIADDAWDRDYDAPLDELPSTAKLGQGDGSSGELPSWMLQHGSAEKERHTMPRTRGERTSPSGSGRTTSAADAEDPSATAEMPQAPAMQAEAAAQPVSEPPQAADGDKHDSDAPQLDSDAIQPMAAEQQPTSSGEGAGGAAPADASDSRGEPGGEPGGMARPAASQGDDVREQPGQAHEHSPPETNGRARKRHEAPDASGGEHSTKPAKRCDGKSSREERCRSIHGVRSHAQPSSMPCSD